MTSKDAYIETVKRQLAGWDGEIGHLDACADIKLLQLEDKYYTLLRTLRGKEREIWIRLQQLKAADEEEWQLLRPVLEGASNDMKIALSTAEQELAPSDLVRVQGRELQVQMREQVQALTNLSEGVKPYGS